jgi:hypothetical protein
LNKSREQFQPVRNVCGGLTVDKAVNRFRHNSYNSSRELPLDITTRHRSIRPPIVTVEKERMAKFELGQLLATPGVLQAAAGDDLMPYLRRHAGGDWGVVSDADRRANDRALVQGTRLLSAYKLGNGTKILDYHGSGSERDDDTADHVNHRRHVEAFTMRRQGQTCVLKTLSFGIRSEEHGLFIRSNS